MRCIYIIQLQTLYLLNLLYNVSLTHRAIAEPLFYCCWWWRGCTKVGLIDLIRYSLILRRKSMAHLIATMTYCWLSSYASICLSHAWGHWWVVIFR